VPALERLRGWRVVASPTAIDRAVWRGPDVIVLRFAPDEAFGIGALGVHLDDPDAIAVPELGFVGARLDDVGLAGVVAHVDWMPPRERPALAQGKVAGVPAKIWYETGTAAGTPGGGDSEVALLITQAAYANDIAERLGWSG
jgi:hypothetical protein